MGPDMCQIMRYSGLSVGQKKIKLSSNGSERSGNVQEWLE